MLTFKEFKETVLFENEIINEANDEIPVQAASDAVGKILGQKSVLLFLNKLKPGTDKVTTWNKINYALTRINVQGSKIADIATALRNYTNK